MQTFIIGSGAGADYSTIYNFVWATCSGIKTDSNVPYVGLLQPQEHSLASLPYQSGAAQYYTDETHYYVFRPQNKQWEGTTDIADCAVIILGTTSSSFYSPIYTQWHNLVFSVTSGIVAADTSRSYLNSTYSLHKNCLFYNIMYRNTDDKVRGMYIGDAITDPNFFVNCVFNNIGISGALVTDNTTFLLRFGGIHINSICDNIWLYSPPVATGILSFGYDTGSSLWNIVVDNNGLQTSLQCPIYNCAFTKSNIEYGPPSSTNLMLNYNMTNHYATGGYWMSDLAMGKESGVYPGANYGSINGVDYWPYTWYDLGPLYYQKRILTLTQNGQSLVFRTK